ncbi:hypothetical protein ACP3PD_17705 [Enterobacter ludwigii]|uniref:hypothetical protein n=1 Tax=Enterobacter ludwigii TaxID=299767 RepID=UPI000B14B79C|nr:hypothetical protein [Enterobacter ludwigii]
MALYGKIRFAGVCRLAMFTSWIGITETPIKTDTPINSDRSTPINFDTSTPIKSDTR